MIRLAQGTDVDALVALERRHGRDELSHDDISLEAQLFDRNDFIRLIENEFLLLSVDGDRIVGYVITAGAGFYSDSPFYKRLFDRARQFAPNTGRKAANLGCYGPVWVDPAYRGKGVFSPMVKELLQRASSRFDCLFTFIAEENQHSLNAHVRGCAMEVVDFFEDTGRGFYLLVK